MNIITLSISGMKCAGCAKSIEDALSSLPEVSQVIVNADENIVEITGIIEPELAINTIEELNRSYKAKLID